MMLRYFSLTTLLVVFLLSACAQDKDAFVGTYTAQDVENEIVLVLKDNGKGTWSTDLDEIQFKWSVRRGGELWLHTVEGGVVQGQIAGNRISLSLPGMKAFVFRRQ